MKYQQPSVSSRITRLLDDIARLKQASDIDRPVVFNAAGEQHARSVAAREAGRKTTT